MPTIPDRHDALTTSANLYPDNPTTDAAENESFFTETLKSLRELAEATPDYNNTTDYRDNVESTTPNADCYLSSAVLTSSTSAAMSTEDAVQLPDLPIPRW